jgi:hypothetical protein
LRHENFLVWAGAGVERISRAPAPTAALQVGGRREKRRAGPLLLVMSPSDIPGRPDLSVIVVTHNRPELALMTLRSALAAIDKLTVEWILIDSGSSDGTPQAIEDAYPELTVQREPNVGFAAANNLGLARASGRYVLLLNPDVETIAGSYDELVATLDAQPEIGVASVVQMAPDGSLQYSIRRFPSAWLSLGEALGAARWKPLRGWREEQVNAARYRHRASVDWLVGAFLIARAEAVAQVGGLDERFFLYSEETDWCFRFHQAGWKVVHLPSMSVTHHTGHAPGGDLSAQLSYAKILFARKHYGRLSATTIRAALALRHGLRASFAGAAGKLRPQLGPRADVERRALGVVLGTSEPPFARKG